jgi:hypothetical protein
VSYRLVPRMRGWISIPGVHGDSSESTRDLSNGSLDDSMARVDCGGDKSKRAAGIVKYSQTGDNGVNSVQIDSISVSRDLSEVDSSGYLTSGLCVWGCRAEQLAVTGWYECCDCFV